jgi:hypothetical protein
MNRLRTLAKFDGHEIIIGLDSCAYYIGPDGIQPIDCPYSGVVMAPPGVRGELAKQLNDKGGE